MTLNRLWAALAVDTCIARGHDHFFLAPGSRCTPMTLAIAQHASAQIVQHYDERGLAFAALGFGRATGNAAVVVCTSGTAVANLLPAVVEASLERIPLLVVSADRPPELRDCGANQAIDQQKIFGDFVLSYFDLPPPTEKIAPQFVRSRFERALDAAKRGPVHLNWMFREPFDASDTPVDLGSFSRPNVVISATRQISTVIPGGKTLVAVGQCRPHELAAAIEMADRWELPWVGDVTCDQRLGPVDLLPFSQLAIPDTIIQVGGRIVSKRWSAYLREWASSRSSTRESRQLVQIADGRSRIDPDHLLPTLVEGPPDEVCAGLSLKTSSPAWFRREWQHGLRLVRDQVGEALRRTSQLSEPSVAQAVAELLPCEHALFLGNSMPIRDFDRFGFAPIGLAPTTTVREELSPAQNVSFPFRSIGSNRGASGIDGLLATACGFATGCQRPTTAIVGDLSFLHDLNSLALVADPKSPPLTVVLLNNHGGGIFDLLPIAHQTVHFERFFVTPHRFRFEEVVRMFGCRYFAVDTLEAFRDTYAESIRGDRSTVIEVTSDRQVNHSIRQRLASTT